ncbi:hypothetical protein ccbrp13_60830 [Ktedonobacteria bacterium brp13]|nr:hypothetical protein ccbrp13_20380 [Ktedonobacteria bacterium brp13]BCL83618.1 hypothetical protein ccbrp13_60830 [Ktedonobacteria bacterium brp13]
METMMISLAQFLRSAPCRHLLVIVPPKLKATLLKGWQQKPADGLTHIEQFSVTFSPQYAQDADICIASIFDIQVQIGVDRTLPFYRLFDVVVLGDADAAHGPVWHRIIEEIFPMLGTRVLPLSLLSEERGILNEMKE